MEMLKDMGPEEKAFAQQYQDEHFCLWNELSSIDISVGEYAAKKARYDELNAMYIAACKRDYVAKQFADAVQALS
jgi:hypothetical protein